MNRIGIIEAPGLIEPLRRAGFSVVTGGEAAMSVCDARKESGPFPVLVADVSRPAIQAWARQVFQPAGWGRPRRHGAQGRPRTGKL